MTTVQELRAGMTTSGETVHACWMPADRGDGRLSAPLPLSLCGRYHITRIRPGLIRLSEPNCFWCIRALRTADKDATWVMEHGDEPAWCIPCGTYTWTPPPRSGVLDDWVCWTCRERREQEAAGEVGPR